MSRRKSRLKVMMTMTNHLPLTPKMILLRMISQITKGVTPQLLLAIVGVVRLEWEELQMREK